MTADPFAPVLMLATLLSVVGLALLAEAACLLAPRLRDRLDAAFARRHLARIIAAEEADVRREMDLLRAPGVTIADTAEGQALRLRIARAMDRWAA